MTHEHLPEGWKRVRLKSVTREIKQRNSDHAFTVADVLGVSNKIGFYPNDREIKDDVSRYKVITHHDFGYNPMRLNVGSLAYRNRPEPGLISPDYVAFRCDTNQLLPEYFNYFRQTSGWWHQIENGGQGSVRIRYYYSDIANFTILLPPVDEQCRITEILHDADANIVCIEAQIETAQEVKRGVMQQLFTFGLAGEGAPTKLTSIGELPASWDVVQLGKVVLEAQYGLSDQAGSNGRYAILRMTNLVDGYVDPSDMKYLDIDEELFKKFQVGRGDILFNRTNSPDLVGKTAIFDLEGQFTFASYIIRLVLDKTRLEPRYLNFHLNTREAQGRLKSLATQGVSQSNINATNLRNFEIPLPKFKEQCEIAAILSAHDEVICTLQMQSTSLREVKRGLMQRLLSGEVRV